MAGLVPFNKRRSNPDFYNMLDDFFSDGWIPGRNLMRDTFKIDVRDEAKEYVVEAELPGVEKNEIELNFADECVTITVKKEETENDEGKNYVHRERRMNSMSRNIRLRNAKSSGAKARMDNGVLTVCIPKLEESVESGRIEIS